MTFNRIQSRSVAGLLTSHNAVWRHLYILGLPDSTLCGNCGVEEETSAYILCECEALVSLRHAYRTVPYRTVLYRTWAGTFSLEPEDIKSLGLGPSGTIVRLRGSHDSIWGTRGPSYSTPRCIGAERPRAQL